MGEIEKKHKKQKRAVYVCLAVIVLFFFSACKSHLSNDTGVYHYPVLPLDESFTKKHVFLIGLDGWGSYSFEKSDIPVIRSSMAAGSYTLDALDVMPSITVPNWASMFMGATPDIHGYKTNPPTNNDPPYAESSVIDKYGLFPSIFTLLKEERPNCTVAYFYEKPKLGYLCPDNVLDKKEHIPDLSGGASALLRITSYIEAEKPNFTAIVFLEPDGIGHSVGHDTNEYYNQLKKLDEYVAQIIQSIQNAGIWNNTILIFSSDHGGIGTSHGNDTAAERKIPVIIAGKNIRPAYTIPGPVMVYDIAPTIAHIFELEIPLFWQGSVLDVFTE
ncbi:alkaline phosphatase [Breznakiella homolactica]|uniref:Alkaline phosphatase n=1 Tax=Breznakiella homolactica TaxID=2798577 RepID=A0A7T7XLX2_9SPIR|nr:alkaline phosphatase [Breznakiella homolactica]QQO08784.1 alkaline phosphatase [Breznakiella homolactica]